MLVQAVDGPTIFPQLAVGAAVEMVKHLLALLPHAFTAFTQTDVEPQELFVPIDAP